MSLGNFSDPHRSPLLSPPPISSPISPPLSTTLSAARRQSKLTARSLNSFSVSKNARNGSLYSQIRTLRCSYAQSICSYAQSNAVKSSSHTPLSLEMQSRQITEVPLRSCSEAIERLRAFRTSYESKQRCTNYVLEHLWGNNN